MGGRAAGGSWAPDAGGCRPGRVGRGRPAGIDLAVLEAGVVTAADVGSGWVSSPQPQATSSDRAIRAIPDCRAVAAVEGRARTEPHLLSDEFTDPISRNGETTLADEVYVHPTVAGARAFLGALHAKPALKCFATLAQLEAGRGATVKTRRAGAGAGDDSAAFESTFAGPGPQGGTVVGLTTDVEVVRVGRTVVAFSFINAGTTPVPQAAAIVAVVVARVRAAS